MSTTNLRRFNNIDDQWEEAISKLSNSGISLESTDTRYVKPICENYPFNQRAYSGKIQYQEPSDYTKGRTFEVGFEFRDGSNLLLIELNTDVQSVDRIIESITNAIPQDLTVYRNLHAPEDSLWNFLQESDKVIDIHILENGYEIPYNEVEDVPVDEVIGKYSIESATVTFSYRDKSIIVQYQEGNLIINSDWDQGQEYIIQLFEREVLANRG